jgi:hypothetical protein
VKPSTNRGRALEAGPSPAAPPRSPSQALTAPPQTASELAVLQAVAAGRPAVHAPKPRAAEPPPQYPPAPRPAPESPAPPKGLWGAIVKWCRSFADEPESYHSPRAGVALPPHPQQNSVLASSPANYGRAGLVALAACGLGVGAYLPWLSGTIDALPFERTGFELGKAWGFTWLAAAVALSALLGVRMRPLRWANVALAAVAAALTARELIDVHDLVNSMNAAAVVRADVGIGLWIMLVSAAGALVASCRIGTPE